MANGNKKCFRVFVLLLTVVLALLTVFAVGCSDNENYPILKWRSDGLYGILPPPVIEFGSVYKETDDVLEFTLNGAEKTDFSLYVQLCSEKGFTHNVVNSEFFYSANTERGYKVSLQYIKSKKEISVSLDASGVLISVGRPSEDFRGLMYTDVVNMMKALGFINVQTQEVSVSANSEHAEYSVEGVTVGGTRFDADQSLVCSLPVVIKYYRRSIELRYSASDLVGKDRAEVEATLRNTGFTNITLQETFAPVNTSMPDSMDGKTISVSINGQTAFTAGDQFPPAAFITVSYHCFDIIMDVSSDSLAGQPKDGVVDKLKGMGFRAIRLIPTFAGGDRVSYSRDDTVVSITVGDAQAFDANKRFKRTDTVCITYYEFDITIAKSAKEFKNDMLYTDAVEYLRSLCFVNIKTEASHELINGWINKPDEIKSITVNGNSKFDADTVFHHDHEIVIVYYAY